MPVIVSASRRTDLPACYPAWLERRLAEGYALVRNPRNPHQVSRIDLSPAAVDGIVLWTKNPLPLLPRIDILRDYAYYFQFTLTPYGPEVEPGLPPKQEVLLPALRELARRAGPERVVWRYDPILLTAQYTLAVHLRCFAEFAAGIAGSAERCTVSFLDDYPSLRGRMRPLGARAPERSERVELMGGFARIARENGLEIAACAEREDYASLGVARAQCVDAALLGRIGGWPLAARRDRNQRPNCGCAESVDIGAYHTCQSGCLYCYANHGAGRVLRSAKSYRPDAPMLCDELCEEDVVRERKA